MVLLFLLLLVVLLCRLCYYALSGTLIVVAVFFALWCVIAAMLIDIHKKAKSYDFLLTPVLLSLILCCSAMIYDSIMII